MTTATLAAFAVWVLKVTVEALVRCMAVTLFRRMRRRLSQH